MMDLLNKLWVVACEDPARELLCWGLRDVANVEPLSYRTIGELRDVLGFIEPEQISGVVISSTVCGVELCLKEKEDGTILRLREETDDQATAHRASKERGALINGSIEAKCIRESVKGLRMLFPGRLDRVIVVSKRITAIPDGLLQLPEGVTIHYVSGTLGDYEKLFRSLFAKGEDVASSATS